MLKSTVENTVLLENNTVEESLRNQLGIQRKYTPAAATDQTVSEDSHIQVTPNQKTLGDL